MGGRFGNLAEEVTGNYLTLDGSGFFSLVVDGEILGSCRQPFFWHFIRHFLQFDNFLLKFLDGLSPITKLFFQFLTSFMQFLDDISLFLLSFLPFVNFYFQFANNLFKLLIARLILLGFFLQFFKLFFHELVLNQQFLVFLLLEGVFHLKGQLIIHLLDMVSVGMGGRGGADG